MQWNGQDPHLASWERVRKVWQTEKTVTTDSGAGGDGEEQRRHQEKAQGDRTKVRTPVYSSPSGHCTLSSD